MKNERERLTEAINDLTVTIANTLVDGFNELVQQTEGCRVALEKIVANTSRKYPKDYQTKEENPILVKEAIVKKFK